MKKILLAIIILNIHISCVQRTASGNEQTDSLAVQSSEDVEDSTDTLWDYRIYDFYTYFSEDGHKRVFGVISTTSTDKSGHALVARDDDNPDLTQYVDLIYQRYNTHPEDSDYYAFPGGIPDLSYYTVSGDKKSFYIVSRVHANSNGWITEYQLFKVDCEKLKANLICECAAIAARRNGFTIAVARLVNEDTARCTADEIWVMHDEYLDWNGNVTKVGKHEYNYKEMESKYSICEDTFIKGFTDIFQSAK